MYNRYRGGGIGHIPLVIDNEPLAEVDTIIVDGQEESETNDDAVGTGNSRMEENGGHGSVAAGDEEPDDGKECDGGGNDDDDADDLVGKACCSGSSARFSRRTVVCEMLPTARVVIPCLVVACSAGMISPSARRVQLRTSWLVYEL